MKRCTGSGHSAIVDVEAGNLPRGLGARHPSLIFHLFCDFLKFLGRFGPEHSLLVYSGFIDFISEQLQPKIRIRGKYIPFQFGFLTSSFDLVFLKL